MDRLKIVFDGIRTISVVIGAIVIFLAVQHPESVIKKQSAEEIKSLERAKIALEILKEENPRVRAESFIVLRSVWGTDKNGWIKEIECQAVAEAGYAQSVTEAEINQMLLRKEVQGIGISGVPGRGPEAARLEAQIEELEKQREYFAQQLEYCNA